MNLLVVQSRKVQSLTFISFKEMKLKKKIYLFCYLLMFCFLCWKKS